MADAKISALPSATYNSGDQFPFVRAGTTSRGSFPMTVSGASIGLGVTPKAWTSFKGFQVGDPGAIASHTFGGANTQTFISNNAYYDGGYKYLLSSSPAAQYIQIGDTHRWNTAASGTADAALTWVERMRLTDTGRLGIGTTSPGAALDVRTDVISAAAGVASFRSTKAADSDDTGISVIKFANDTTTAQVFARFIVNAGATTCGQINANGASTAAFGSYSDSRLKENIEDLPSQLNNILALRPVEFDYIESEGGGHQIGFIAQEMQGIYPDVVGERAPDGMLMVTGWDKTSARLVKAIQEQQAIIESLEARLAALEA